MDGILGQVGSRQLVPINRNILVWTVYCDRLVPGDFSQLGQFKRYVTLSRGEGVNKV